MEATAQQQRPQGKVLAFAPATKRKAKLRLALIGPSGSGKTYSALAIAQGLAPGGKVALIDTERGSASKYADKFAFQTMELETFEPATFIAAVKAAEAGGFDVLIIDSLSHAWNGREGMLEQVDKIAARNRSNNSFSAWREAGPLQNKLVDAIVGAKLHVIVTLRVTTEWVVEKDERTGKSAPRKVGLKPVQKEGIEFEFDVVGDLADARFTISKTRCSALSKACIDEPGAELGKQLREWLTDGSEEPVRPDAPSATPVAAPAPAPVSPPAPAPAPTGPRPQTSGQLRMRAIRVWKTLQKGGASAETFAKWTAQVLGNTKPQPEWTEADLEALETAAMQESAGG